MIIALCGYAGAGKDTLGEYLDLQHGFRRAAFADALKGIAAAIGWDWNKEDRPPCEKCGMRQGRDLLQRLGTEGARQHLGEDVWVRGLMRTISQRSLDWVITDLRFPNEAEALRALGAKIWRIYRPGVAPANGHASELDVDRIKADAVVWNAGEPWEMFQAAARMLKAPVGQP